VAISGSNIFIASLKIRNVGIKNISHYYVVAGLAIIFGAATFYFVPTLNLSSVIPDSHFSHNGNIAEAALLPLLVDDYDKTYEMFNDGKAGLVRTNSDTVDPENHCEFCLRIDYTPGAEGKAGIALASKEPLNLNGAERVVVFARAQIGGDKVKFFAAGEKTDAALGDLSSSAGWAAVSQEITLGNEWRKYEMDVSQGDLKNVGYFLGIELPKNDDRTKIVIYLQGVTVDGIDPERPIPLEDPIISNVTALN
jgi:hypothetical protein